MKTFVITLCCLVVMALFTPAISISIAEVVKPARMVKPGTCPDFPENLIVICIAKCVEDDDCPGTKKCCNIGCAKWCTEPVG